MTVAGVFGSFPKIIVQQKLFVKTFAIAICWQFCSMSQCGSIFHLLKMQAIYT